jgi:hypothetical protein
MADDEQVDDEEEFMLPQGEAFSPLIAHHSSDATLPSPLSEELDGEEEELMLKKAAACLVCAFKGRKTGLHARYSAYQYRLQRIYQNLWALRLLNVGLFVSISFIERPSWCYDRPCTSSSTGSTPGEGHILMWGSPPFEWWQTTLLELVCVCFYAAELCAKHSYGRQVFYQNYVNHTRIAMLLLLLSDILWTFLDNSHFRFGQFLRPAIMVAFSSKLQRSFKNIARVTPNCFDVVLLLVYLIVVYGSFGRLLFHGTPEGQRYFPTLGSSFLNLFVLLTTANNPSVMTLAYKRNRWSCLFFISFIVMGVFFLMNLMLASIYTNYSKYVQRDREKWLTRRREGIADAFKCMDFSREGRVHLKYCRAVLDHLLTNHSHLGTLASTSSWSVGCWPQWCRYTLHSLYTTYIYS